MRSVSENADGSDWYGFDTSAEPVDGEFPIFYIGHGAMIWERMPLASTFVEFCRGTDQSDHTAYWDWWKKKQAVHPR